MESSPFILDCKISSKQLSPPVISPVYLDSPSPKLSVSSLNPWASQSGGWYWTRLPPLSSFGYGLRTFLRACSHLSHKLRKLAHGPLWREWGILILSWAKAILLKVEARQRRGVEEPHPLKHTDTHVFFQKPPKALTLLETGRWELMQHRGRGKASQWSTDQCSFPPYYSCEGNSLLLYQKIKKGRKLGNSVLKGTYLHTNVSRLHLEDKEFIRQNGIHAEYNVLST